MVTPRRPPGCFGRGRYSTSSGPPSGPALRDPNPRAVMSGSTNRNDAVRLLRGLEDGRMTASEGAFLAQDLDPVLVYVILRYLREVYPASNPAANAVLERVVALTSSWPKIVAKSKEGE